MGTKTKIIFTTILFLLIVGILTGAYFLIKSEDVGDDVGDDVGNDVGDDVGNDVGNVGNVILQPNGGNVGIGTTAPATTLHMDLGAINNDGTKKLYLQYGGTGAVSTAGDGGLSGPTGFQKNCPFKLFNEDYSTYGIGLDIGHFSDTGDCYIQCEAANTGARDILLQPYTGNVGIGTVSPSVKLDVNGVIRGVEFLAGRSSSTLYQGDRITFTDSNYYVLNASSVGVRLASGSTAWVAQSDINKKHNIENIGNVLDKIKDYRCICYSLKADDTNDMKIGFVAQDWVDDFPEIIDKEPDGTLGMKYTETIPILLRAIQEQQTTINNLLSRIESLENKE